MTKLSGSIVEYKAWSCFPLKKIRNAGLTVFKLFKMNYWAGKSIVVCRGQKWNCRTLWDMWGLKVFTLKMSANPRDPDLFFCHLYRRRGQGKARPCLGPLYLYCKREWEPRPVVCQEKAKKLACHCLGTAWTNLFPMNGKILPRGLASPPRVLQSEFSLSGAVSLKTLPAGSSLRQLAEASTDPFCRHKNSA